MVCQNFLIAIGSFKLPTLARLCRDLVVLETQQAEETRIKRAAQATYRDSILKNQNDFDTFHCHLVTSLLPQPLTVLSPLWPSGPFPGGTGQHKINIVSWAFYFIYFVLFYFFFPFSFFVLVFGFVTFVSFLLL